VVNKWSKAFLAKKAPQKRNLLRGIFLAENEFFSADFLRFRQLLKSLIKSRKTAWLGGFRGGQR
jgi:hypothetical protein